MRLPVFKSKNNYSRNTVNFGGLNYIQNYKEGDILDCEGISHECFPSITQRRKSVTEFECEAVKAAIYGDKECVATDTGLYYDRKCVGELVNGEKIIEQIGNKIVVFPDKMYYDIEEKKFGSLEGKCVLENIETTFKANSISVPEKVYTEEKTIESMNFKEGEKVFKYGNVTVNEGRICFENMSLINASELSGGDIFSEVSGNSHYRIVQQIFSDEGTATQIVCEYVTVRNIAKDVFSELREGDVIEITGCDEASNNKEARIIKCSADKLEFADGTFTECVMTSGVTVKRKIPDFSFVCVYENRLWGCVGNVIYGSALGDPFNFFKYDNLSTDSYTVQSNTAGEFTAAIAYGNCCLFFKESKCYKLYGTRPSNFQLIECFGAGIMKNDFKSLVNLNGKLFYKGNNGVYSFFGGMPQKISESLGDISLKNCSAGADGNCYYLSGDKDGQREEFVYDEKHGLWSKSGYKNVIGYFSSGENLYRLTAEGVKWNSADIDGDCQWFVEFCPFDEQYYKTKNYSRLYITAQLFENAWIKAEISGDEGNWQTVCVRYGKKKEYINIPCVLKNNHQIKLKISGKGRCVIESIVREFCVN